MKLFLPMSQWTQLKIGLSWWLGEQRMRARKGWMKQRPTVTKPMMAWGLVEMVLLMSRSSSRMRMKPAMVRPQVTIMKVRCQMNHWSRLKHRFDVHVCLKYLQVKNDKNDK